MQLTYFVLKIRTVKHCTLFKNLYAHNLKIVKNIGTNCSIKYE